MINQNGEVYGQTYFYITFFDIQVGDTIEFGSYRGEKIEWRVLKLSNNGKSAVIVSKDILCNGSI